MAEKGQTPTQPPHETHFDLSTSNTINVYKISKILKLMLIAKGAEAEIIKERNKIIKRRIKKGYRIHVLDEKLRRLRTKKESKLLLESKRVGVPVPSVLETKKYEIVMEFISGSRLKEIVEERPDLIEELGKHIATFHEHNIIHGDVTTSNAIFNDRLYIIDFGLGFFSNRIEDKATDLWVLKEVLESSHRNADILWKRFLKAYKKHYKNSEKVIKRLEKIQKRGRYKKR